MERGPPPAHEQPWALLIPHWGPGAPIACVKSVIAVGRWPGASAAGGSDDDAQRQPILLRHDSSLSRAHFEIRRAPSGEITVIGRSTTNGTYLNGERITAPQRLTADDIIQFGDVPFRVLHDATDALTRTVCHNVGDQAAALVQFDQMMIDRAVTPNYQPIVRLDDLSSIGQEVLGRSQVPNLETASAMFSAATQFNRQKQLSQMFRWKAIQETMSRQPPPHPTTTTPRATITTRPRDACHPSSHAHPTSTAFAPLSPSSSRVVVVLEGAQFSTIQTRLVSSIEASAVVRPPRHT